MTVRQAPGRFTAALALLLITGEPTAAAAASDHAALTDIVAARVEIAKDFATPISKCVVRHDTSHPVFHGCIDWHSSAHGFYALTAIARATADRKLLDWVSGRLDVDGIAAERRTLAANPSFEMPYGRAWFLRLAIEYRRAGGDDRLVSMADEVADSLIVYLRSHRFDPMIGSYKSETWALLALHAYGVFRKNADTLAFVDDKVARALNAGGGECPFALDSRLESFMAVCTNWAWLVAESVSGPTGTDAIHAILPPEARMTPVLRLTAAHLAGLDFSRAWGLWAVWKRTREEPYLAAYVEHFRHGYLDRSRWAGDYDTVGHWVGQFGVFALMPLFDPGP